MKRKKKTHTDELRLALSMRQVHQSRMGFRREALLKHKILQAKANGDPLLRGPLSFWAEEMLCRTDRIVPFVARIPTYFVEELQLPSAIVEFAADGRVFVLTKSRERERLLVAHLFLGYPR